MGCRRAGPCVADAAPAQMPGRADMGTTTPLASFSSSVSATTKTTPAGWAGPTPWCCGGTPLHRGRSSQRSRPRPSNSDRQPSMPVISTATPLLPPESRFCEPIAMAKPSRRPTSMRATSIPSGRCPSLRMDTPHRLRVSTETPGDRPTRASTVQRPNCSANCRASSLTPDTASGPTRASF